MYTPVRDIPANIVVQDLARSHPPAGFRGRSAFTCQLWWIVQSTLFGCSPQIFYGWRNFLLRLFGAKVGTGVKIRPSVRITYPWKVEIGDHVGIGDNAVVYSLGPIFIGANACVSQRTYLCAATHDFRDATFPLVEGAIHVEEQAWVAADVFVAPGVTIGKGAVVGSRSTVLNDVPPFAIAVGYPAKPVKMRLPGMAPTF